MYKNILAVIMALFITSCANKGVIDDQSTDVGSVSFDQAAIENFRMEAGDKVFFAYDSSLLSGDAISTLEKVVAWFKAKGVKSITVEGHCDDRGTREYNLGLGERRARAIASYLQDQVPELMINVVSYGKDKPVATAEGESIEEVRTQNRVGIIVIE